MATYHVENFGCRATQADGAAIDRQFEERGLARADAVDADIVILNTCTVTGSADQDARSAIRRVQRQNPEAKIVVTGCYAQRAPQEIAALPGVSCVVGNSHKHQLADLVLAFDLSSQVKNTQSIVASWSPHEAFVPLGALTQNSDSGEASTGTRFGDARLFVSDIFAHTELLAAPVFELVSRHNNGFHEARRTRPNLKVQDGCDNRCSFCVIPYVRGQSRSLPLARVLEEVHGLVAAGYREVVISGINLGRWGRDLDLGRRAPVFEDLIRAILDRTSLEKLRISSVEPMDWSDELIRMVGESPRIAKHAHVPLQSGSDAVLRRMHRKYRPWHYREKIEKIRATMPNAAIGADVMVGFPGETDAQFEATRRLIEDLPFTYLHVFTYSARPGTPTAGLGDQLPIRIARERNRVLREIGEQKKRAFMQSFVGHKVEAITLGSEGNGSYDSLRVPDFTAALTDNYLRLRLIGSHSPNCWIKAEVKAVDADELVGQAV